MISRSRWPRSWPGRRCDRPCPCSPGTPAGPRTAPVIRDVVRTARRRAFRNAGRQDRDRAAPRVVACPTTTRSECVFVSRAYVPESQRPPDHRQWPFSVPAVAEVTERGLEFMRPVTFLVGDNGSGKSTLVEAIAEGFNLDARGGRAAKKAGNPDPTRTSLGEVLRLETTTAGARMLAGPRLKKKGFFLRAETAFSMTENLGGVPGYWTANTAEMSHGEGFLEVFRSMFRDPGFYVMDEPESALSFTACLHLVALLHELGESGAQV